MRARPCARLSEAVVGRAERSGREAAARTSPSLCVATRWPETHTHPSCARACSLHAQVELTEEQKERAAKKKAADEHKAKGNDAYKAKQFPEAITHYEV